MSKESPKKITESYLHNAGLHYLQRFATSKENFRRVMTRKIERSCRTHTDQDIKQCLEMLDGLIEKFQRAGLIDDTVYIDGAVRSLRRRGISSRDITRKLQAKGLDPDAVRNAIRSRDSSMKGFAEIAAAARYIQRRRIGPCSRHERNDPTGKDLSALARAGFSCEVAHKVLRMNIDEIEALITEGYALS